MHIQATANWPPLISSTGRCVPVPIVSLVSQKSCVAGFTGRAYSPPLTTRYGVAHFRTIGEHMPMSLASVLRERDRSI